MKINRIVLKNFRQFYAEVCVDLTTNNEKNIILIGGKNGHGKTNFLLGIVWCLYGESINNVDDSFKMEINNNYSKFLDSVLNKDIKKEGNHNFSVELLFSDVLYGSNDKESIITVKRSYNTDLQEELLEIIPNDEELLELNTKEEKQNFINDYLVPIEIARFVFFDAEKISQIADLNSAKQAKLMDKTLGNMLGLNIYQNLLDEIEGYIRKLKKDSSTHEILEQITQFENKISSNTQRIKSKNNNLQQYNKEIQEIIGKIEQLERDISRKGGDNNNIEDLQGERVNLEKQRDEVQLEFHKMVDVMPLLMLSSLIQEAKEHIDIEENNKENELTKKSFSEKADLFIDQLFNKGDLPNPDINFNQKTFYADKSKKLAKCFIDSTDNIEYSLPFKHNLDRSKIKDLNSNYDNIKNKSDTNFSKVITQFFKTKNELETLEKTIKQSELMSADDLTKSFIDDKKNFENKKDDLNKKIGSIENDISKLETENSTDEKRLSILYDTSKVNKTNQEKIELSEKYTNVLKDFIQEEKNEKKESIKDKLLTELNNLWHKELVKDVRITILSNDKGMEVELFDSNLQPVNSEKLSKGEQQLYISALLKSILDNSIHNLPVFIDTPLARLDSTHRDNILKHYYPKLSNQVVIFSTDTEITTSKYNEINQYIAQNYLINNTNGKSDIHKGYFN